MCHGRSTGPGVRTPEFQFWLCLGQGPSISEPQLAHLWNGEVNKSSHSSRLLRGSLEIKEVTSASSHIKSDTRRNCALANIS